MSEQQVQQPSGGSAPQSQASAPSQPSTGGGDYGSGAQSQMAHDAWSDSLDAPIPTEQTQQGQEGQQQPQQQQQPDQKASEAPPQAPVGFESVFYGPNGFDYDKMGSAFANANADYKYNINPDEHKIEPVYGRQLEPDAVVDEKYKALDTFEQEWKSKNLEPLERVFQKANAGDAEGAFVELQTILQQRQAEYKQALREKEKEIAKKFAMTESDTKRYQEHIAKADANFATVARELNFTPANLENLLFGHTGADGKFQASPHGAPLINAMVATAAEIAANYPNFAKLNPAERYQIYTATMNSDPARIKTVVSYVADKFSNVQFPNRLAHERKKWAEEQRKQSFNQVPSPGSIGTQNAPSQNPMADDNFWG